jgi:hypothetical protein
MGFELGDVEIPYVNSPQRKEIGVPVIQPFRSRYGAIESMLPHNVSDGGGVVAVGEGETRETAPAVASDKLPGQRRLFVTIFGRERSKVTMTH